MKCFYCKKEISEGRGELLFVALDRPYVMLPFHREPCLRTVEGDGLPQYLQDNSERVWQYASSPLGNKKDNSVKRKQE